LSLSANAAFGRQVGPLRTFFTTQPQPTVTQLTGANQKVAGASFSVLIQSHALCKVDLHFERYRILIISLILFLFAIIYNCFKLFKS